MASSTLIKLFLEMLKFFKKKKAISKIFLVCLRNGESFGIF